MKFQFGLIIECNECVAIDEMQKFAVESYLYYVQNNRNAP